MKQNAEGVTPVGPAFLVPLQTIRGDDGMISVAEIGKHFEFPVRRVFTITDVPMGATRGGHAHREVSQLLVCLAGAIDVTIDDGSRTWSVALDRPDKGLLIPVWVWASQSYTVPGSILVVLCDQEYRESEYIRDYDEFVTSVASRG